VSSIHIECIHVGLAFGQGCVAAGFSRCQYRFYTCKLCGD
jgi:hypothetical protein